MSFGIKICRVLACFLSCSCTWAEEIRIAVIHSNDLYGQLTPRQGHGGMAARVGLIRKLRASEPVIVLDAGDALRPHALSGFDAGATMVAAMNRARYAAMGVGNHDLSLGWDVLTERQREMAFSMLAANLIRKDGGTPPLPGYVLTQVGDVQVGIIGVLGARVVPQIDPRHLTGLGVADPVETVDSLAVVLRRRNAQCIIVLTHMDEVDALRFARAVNGVDLIVAGGFGDLDRSPQVPRLIRLVNGLAMVTTPRYGISLGRVVLHLSAGEQGELKVVNVSADHIPVDRTVTPDAETEQLVSDLRRRYARAAGQPLGRIFAQTLEDQGRVVAGLMRRHVNAEVGIVNRGGVGRVPANRALTVGHINQLLRFDERLVKMKLTGAQLLRIVRQSQTASRDGVRLIFFGLSKNTINGRPIQKDEWYRVAIAEFLAHGGDGYAEFLKGTDIVFTNTALRGLVVVALRDTQIVLAPRDFDVAASDGIWHLYWAIEGAFHRNHIDGTTLSYRAQKERVSFLSGETSMAWHTALQAIIIRDLGKQVVTLDQRLATGQVGTTFGDLARSEDQIATELVYRYRTEKFVADPFVAAGYSTALRPTDGQRPKLLHASTGFQRRFARALTLRLGVRGQRDWVVNGNDWGVEVRLDYRRALGNGEFRSRTRGFAGLTDRQILSLENANTLLFPLVRALRLSVQQRNFLYRVDRIADTPVDGIANRWDLTLGLICDLGWKWY